MPFLATIFARAEPSEGFSAPEGMLDCSEYEWPGSSGKPGLNHQLIQSACHQGPCSFALIAFRRNCGIRSEQVARPACNEMCSPPTCMFPSCAVYVPWKTRCPVEEICIRKANEFFTHADSASEVRRRGVIREPIKWGWIGKWGMQMCIRNTNASYSWRIICVPGNNCETQDAIRSQMGFLHSTKSLQITVQLEGVGAARGFAMPQYCEYHVEEREQPCQPDIRSGKGRLEFMQMSDLAKCQLEPSIAICEHASFPSGCLDPQCCSAPEGNDLKSRWHQTVTKSGTPSAPNCLPFPQPEKPMVQDIQTMAIIVRSTLAEKSVLGSKNGPALQSVPKTAAGPVNTRGGLVIPSMLLQSPGQCLNGNSQGKIISFKYPDTAPGVACEVTKLLLESDGTPTRIMIGAKQDAILSNGHFGRKWPSRSKCIKTLDERVGKWSPFLTTAKIGQFVESDRTESRKITRNHYCGLSLPIGCIIRWRWYLSSVRIGEADNPGPPKPPGICISAFNPTSVYQRSQHLSECGDVVLLSETSATHRCRKLKHGHSEL